jgi:hypothetical protein
MRRTHLPAADRGIWIPGGGRRRVRPRRGAGDPCFDARGTTFAIAHRGYELDPVAGRCRQTNPPLLMPAGFTEP